MLHHVAVVRAAERLSMMAGLGKAQGGPFDVAARTVAIDERIAVVFARGRVVQVAAASIPLHRADVVAWKALLPDVEPISDAKALLGLAVEAPQLRVEPSVNVRRLGAKGARMIGSIEPAHPYAAGEREAVIASAHQETDSPLDVVSPPGLRERVGRRNCTRGDLRGRSYPPASPRCTPCRGRLAPRSMRSEPAPCTPMPERHCTRRFLPGRIHRRDAGTEFPRCRHRHSLRRGKWTIGAAEALSEGGAEVHAASVHTMTSGKKRNAVARPRFGTKKRISGIPIAWELCLRATCRANQQ